MKPGPALAALATIFLLTCALINRTARLEGALRAHLADCLNRP